MKAPRIILTTLIVAAAATGLTAQAANSPIPQPSLLQQKEIGTPFKGLVEAVDTKASTLTVGGMVILIADSTKLTKQGRTITLADIKVADYVQGKTHKNADGKTEALHVKVAGKNQ